MGAIRDAMVEILAAENPMTVRGVFYALVSRRVIAKTEQEYKGTVCRLLADMRRQRTIPYTWIADGTRWMRKPTTFGSVDDALRATAHLYRRDLCADADGRVEVWLEKEALAGVIHDVTEVWDVPLMVTRGYPSQSFLYSAAQVILDAGVPSTLYHLGDHDPSGRDIDRAIVAGIVECVPALVPDVDFTLQRLAVTSEQIEEFGLPTRPTKGSDVRTRRFEGESVEVDAIPPQVLRTLCEEAIEAHVDRSRLKRLKIVEKEERRVLKALADHPGAP
jgi:hypothetical protein